MYDRETTFSLNQSVTTGVQLSTDVYDSLLSGSDINANRELELLVEVTQDFAGGTSLKVDFIQSNSVDLSNPDVLASSPVIPEAELVIGKRLLATGVPATSKQYLGLRFTSVGTHTSGKVFGGMVRDIQSFTFPAANTGYTA